MRSELIVATAMAISGTDTAAATYVKAGDDSPLVRMVKEGNTEGLDAYALRGTDHLARLFVEAGAERSRFDLGASADRATACYARAKALELPAVGFLMACAELRVGNALLAGHFKDWTLQADQARRDIYPLLRQQAGKALRMASLESPPANAFTRWPTPTWRRDAASSAVPAFPAPLEGMKTLVFVDAVANGSAVAMMVNTGSQITILSRADAKRAKAEESGMTVMEVASSQDAKGIAVNAARLDTLKLGGMTLSNANLGIWDMPFSVLGLDLLRQLPAPIRVTSDGITFDAGRMPNDCSGHLFLQGELGARPVHLFSSGSLDGIRTAFKIDTGNDGGIIRRSRPGDLPGKPVNVTTLSGHATIHTANVRQSAGIGTIATSQAVRVISDESAQERLVGAAAIRAGGALWLNFAQQRGCLLTVNTHAQD
ncbi:retroviral-like aspartic protease family protein [Bacillus sp. NP157]|nr:retroviral-like aspartic protease family protein [Bacillus sp. NP157]